MAEDRAPQALPRLMSWLSPAFPIGAFAYSHGLEQAIHDGAVRDRATLVDWLSDLVQRGSGWNDAVLLAEAWRVTSAQGDCKDVAELAEALAGSRQRHMETTLQGAAFAEAVAAWDGLAAGQSTRMPTTETAPSQARKADEAAIEDNSLLPYPVAVGIATARHGIPLPEALTAFLHAFTSSLIQVTVRLLPLGQRDGVRALAQLEPVLLATAARAARSTLDDLGSCTVMSEIMSMKHEVLYSRVFRS